MSTLGEQLIPPAREFNKRVAELNGRLVTIKNDVVTTTTGENQFEQGQFLVVSGAKNDNTRRIRSINFIDTEEFQDVKSNAGYKFLVFAWNKTDGTYVGNWNGEEFLTSTSGLQWLTEFSHTDIPNSDLYKYKFVVAKNDVYENISTTEASNILFSVSKFVGIESDIDELQTLMDEGFVQYQSANWMDIDSPLTKHYVLWQSGSLSDTGASHYFVSQPIPVKTGDVVRKNVSESASFQFGAYVKADGTADAPSTIYTSGNSFTAERDGYISVNFNSAHLNDAMVTINEAMPSEFVRYVNERRLSNDVHLNDTQIDDIGASSPLSGKLIAYNGDSICESRISQGTASNGGSYPKLIADMITGTYENRGISGGILASAPGDGGSTPARCVVSDVENMTADADLVCFEGGINDYWRQVPLGTYSESDYSGELDTTTVCGALESIFRKAKIRWNGKPIVFIIVHKIKSTVYAQNTAGYTFAQEREKMVGICEKYAIPYYDAYAKSGLNAYVDIQNQTFLTSNSTGTADGCHPNEEGYKKYYVPQLIKLFESVMPV